MTPPARLPHLRDHLLDPSGGLVYHLRALRHRRRWAAFHATVAGWLNGWQPASRHLVIVGPSAGYALPPGFLARFDSVVALEPDPLARWLLRRRPDAARVRFDTLDCLSAADSLGHLAARFPDAAVLFSNVLGQIDAHLDDWSALITRHLAGQPWASYHDVMSTHSAPSPTAPASLLADDALTPLLGRFWPASPLEIVDHGTFRLGGRGPFGYALWPITTGRWHLVEWASGGAQAHTSTWEPGSTAAAVE